MTTHPGHVTIQVDVPDSMETDRADAGRVTLERFQMRRDKIAVSVERQREDALPPSIGVRIRFPASTEQFRCDGCDATRLTIGLAISG